ncbi:MAG: MFS transporter [Streptomycetaceae bacterium]|nr:MFS transporter [Streptomycetaceae bacterium]
MSASPAPAPRTARGSGWSLALLALAGLITALDFTIVYVALPDIAEDVGFTEHSLQWVVSAYAVVYGGLLLLGGRLSDLLGRRRVFQAGMALYGIGSLLGGLADTTGLLIAARAAQGLGGAVLFPATLTLVTTMFEEGPARNRALTVWSVSGAAGLSLGSLLGGLLTSAFGWPAVFFVNVPLVVVGGVASFWLLAPDGERVKGRGFDLPGALSGTAALTLFVFALAQGPEWGWGSGRVVAALAAAVVLLVLFAAVERRAAHPLLPLRLVADRSLSASATVILVFGATLQAVPYFLTLFLQNEMGYSALRTGVAFLGPTLSITAGNLISERLIPRLGVRGMLIVAFVIGGAGTACLAAAMTGGASYPQLLGGIIGYGLGCGLAFNTMWMAAATGVPAADQGVASGFASTAMQFGAGAGLAVLVSLDGIRTAVSVAAAGAVLGVLAALLLPRRDALKASPPVAAADSAADGLEVEASR